MSKSKIAGAGTTAAAFSKACELIDALPRPDLSSVLGPEHGHAAEVIDEAMKQHMIDRAAEQGVAAVPRTSGPPKYAKGRARHSVNRPMTELIEALLHVYVETKVAVPSVSKGEPPTGGEPTVRFVCSILGAHAALVTDELEELLPGLRESLQPKVGAIRKRVMRSALYQTLKDARAGRVPEG